MAHKLPNQLQLVVKSEHFTVL